MAYLTAQSSIQCSGAGSPAVNGLYSPVEPINGHPRWQNAQNPNLCISYDDGQWWLGDKRPCVADFYTFNGGDFMPPLDNQRWEVCTGTDWCAGVAPIPWMQVSQQQPSGYGAPPPNTGYGAPPPNTGYGGQPQNMGYGGQPQNMGYGAPPPNVQQPYGAPPPNVQQPYGAPPTNNYGQQPPAPSYGMAAPNANSFQPPPPAGGYGYTQPPPPAAEENLANQFQNMGVKADPTHGHGTLTVTVQRGEKMKDVSTFGGEPDTYVTVRCKENRSAKVEKTRTIKDKFNPQYNESFTFVIRDSFKDGDCDFAAFQKNKMTRDTKLGSCQVTMQHIMDQLKGDDELTINLMNKGRLGGVVVARFKWEYIGEAEDN